jgi:hypothetical protein
MGEGIMEGNTQPIGIALLLLFKELGIKNVLKKTFVGFSKRWFLVGSL